MRLIVFFFVFSGTVLGQLNEPIKELNGDAESKKETSVSEERSPLDKPEVRSKLMRMLTSSSEKTRLAGFKAVHHQFESGKLKVNDRRSYRVIVDKASSQHLENLKSHLSDIVNPSALSRNSGSRIFKTFNRHYTQWYIAALNSREMVQNDWRRVQQRGSFEGMQKETSECFKYFISLYSSWKNLKESRDYVILYEHYNAVNQCREQVSWCDGGKKFEPIPLNRMISVFAISDYFKKTLDRVDSFDKQLENHKSTKSFNYNQEWASQDIKKMIDIINNNRLRMGLECFMLDKLLSNVSYKHSQDMVKREFFSHIGSDGKNHEQRAGDVNWYGGTFGEVLFSGSKDSKTVHDSWWNSEDNRPKIYQEHLNRIGIGIFDKTWTGVVGSTYESRSNHYIKE